LDTIALAACILDSLDSKFSLNWRLACPLTKMDVSAAKRHTIPTSPLVGNQLHIDSVYPEVIILSSLIIAFKFLEDCHEPTQYFSSSWGGDLWACEQINATERCVMESLGYRILPLWDRRLIGDALADMERAGRHALSPSQQQQQPREACLPGSSEDLHRRSMSTGKAVAGLGLQPTPAETPNCETAFGGPIHRGHHHYGRAAGLVSPSHVPRP
jgi:hypothetical protein